MTEENKSTSSSDNLAGFAKIKAEYLAKDCTRQLNLDFVAKDDKKRLLSDHETEENGADTKGSSKRKKLKGQNKHRPREARVPKSEKLCTKILTDNCPYGDGCCFSHDIQKFAENKPKDIGDTCYLYVTYGKCPYGFSCRFASQHIKDKVVNIVNEQLWDKYKDKVPSLNTLSKDLQAQLRKRAYCFKKSNEILKLIENRKHLLLMKASTNNHVVPQEVSPSCDKDVTTDPVPDLSSGNDGASELSVSEAGDGSVSIQTSSGDTDKLECGSGDMNNTDKPVSTESSPCGAFIDNTTKPFHPTSDEESARLRLLTKKKIDFNDKLYLAPLTTVGNLPFRRICKEFGADITCGEMAMCTNLLQGQQSEWALLRRHPSETIFGVQLCGAHPDIMTRCAQLLSENTSVDFVDINMGCPIDIVYQKGAGCGLMNRLKKFEDIVFGMTSVMDMPLTIKLRTGIYENKNIAHNVISKINEWGSDRIAAIALHGRSREQRYTKLANWDYIKECAELAKPIPFFGCGDILSFEDANIRRQQTGISGIMIARGALIKPWIFTEIKEQRHWDISSSERFDIIKRYVNYGLEHWGSDTEGVEKTRRFLLEWLSFLYRYIPVGLLERVPQKINERPPPYVGRDDLETLMASPSCADWIKISEMLLGPVSENFVFLPKHKAHAYQ